MKTMPNTTTKYLVFKESETLALPTTAVEEVLPYHELSLPPVMASFVAGVANIGGTAVTVLRLGELLGRSVSPPDLGSHLISLKGPNSALALLVERALSTIDGRSVSLALIEEENSFNGLVQADLLHDGEFLAHLLDPAALLTEEERKRTGDFARRAQARLDGLEAV